MNLFNTITLICGLIFAVMLIKFAIDTNKSIKGHNK